MYKSLNTQMLGHKVPFFEQCKLAAAFGFEGVDLDGNSLRELTSDSIQEALVANSVVPGIVGLPVGYNGTMADLDGNLEALDELAPKAAKLGYNRTTTVVMPGHATMAFRENFAYLVERLSPIAMRLDYYGIRLGLEFIGPKTLRDTLNNTFLHSWDGVLGLCAAIGAPNVGLLVDIFHLFTGHASMDEMGRLRNEDIVLVHLNDGRAGLGPDEQIDLERDLPGANDVTDINSFLMALDRIGYDGPCSVEPFLPRLRELSVEEAVNETAASLRRVWAGAGLN